MKPKAIFEHDCERCEFLAHIELPETIRGESSYDLYYCPGEDGGSIIVRYGNDGPEYASCLMESANNMVKKLPSLQPSSMAIGTAFFLADKGGYVKRTERFESLYFQEGKHKEPPRLAFAEMLDAEEEDESED